MKRARAVLWDIDGTYVDSEGTHNRALMDALAHWNISPSADLQRRLVGASMEDAYATLSIGFAQLPNMSTLLDLKLQAYFARAGELALRPGVLAARERIRDRSVASAWVSNSDRLVVDVTLRAVGVRQLGLITIARNDVRHGKPHAEPYLRAAHLLEVEPRDCVVVEDSPVGAAAGLAAGMTVIAWPERRRLDATFPAGVVLARPDDLALTLAAVGV